MGQTDLKAVVAYTPAKNATQGTVSVTMSLAAAEKGFNSLSVSVQDVSGKLPLAIPVSIPPYTGPTPGGAPVTVNATFFLQSPGDNIRSTFR